MVVASKGSGGGCSDGGAPSAQAALTDADAVTGAQRDPTQLVNAYPSRSGRQQGSEAGWLASKSLSLKCASVVHTRIIPEKGAEIEGSPYGKKERKKHKRKSAKLIGITSGREQV